jgi:hypothetical protein
MKSNLLIAFIFLALKSIAQPTFTAADLNFVIGETISSQEVDTTGVFQGGAGPNQVWNFTLSTIGSSDTFEIISVDSVSFSPAFPSANIVFKNASASGDVNYSFFSQNQDSSVFLGQVSISPPNLIDTLIFSNPLLYFQYPFSYLTAYNDVYEITTGINASINKSATLFDAYGDITINGVLFSNVIRKHEFDTAFFGGTSPDTIYYENFEWIALGEKWPLLNISYFRFGSSGGYEKGVEVSSKVFSSLSHIKGNSEFVMYPNPATTELKIQHDFKGNMSYTIKDLSGKIIFSDRLNQLSRRIDITSLESGIYILEIRTKDNVLTKKFVKRS